MIKNIILDTDIGADSDDIGALAILCQLAQHGKIHLLAVTSCSSTIEAVKTIDIIARQYGLDNLPIGMSTERYADTADYGGYTRAISATYPSSRTVDNTPSSVQLLRAMLSQHQDVTLVTVGPFNNIRQLLDSKADDICDSDGITLLNNSVVRAYCMAGNLAHSVAEWNVTEDLLGAQMFLQNYANELIVSPYELGQKVLTGHSFLTGEDNPMKLGYYVHNKVARQSWDPITAYVSATDDYDTFPISPCGTISIDVHGIMTFDNNGTKHRYLLDDIDIAKAIDTLEQLMRK